MNHHNIIMYFTITSTTRVSDSSELAAIHLYSLPALTDALVAFRHGGVFQLVC